MLTLTVQLPTQQAALLCVTYWVLGCHRVGHFWFNTAVLG